MKTYRMPIVFYAYLETEAESQEEAEKELDDLFHKAYYGCGALNSNMDNFKFVDYEREEVVGV